MTGGADIRFKFDGGTLDEIRSSELRMVECAYLFFDHDSNR